MAPMNYNTSEDPVRPVGGEVGPGEYAFDVIEAAEKIFNSGNEGANLTLLVHAPQRDVKVFDTLVYVSTSLWKVEDCLGALGFDYKSPPEIYELVGCTGRAKFKKGKPKKDRWGEEKRFLEVESYLPREEGVGPIRAPGYESSDHSYGPAPMDEPPPLDDSDAPF